MEFEIDHKYARVITDIYFECPTFDSFLQRVRKYGLDDPHIKFFWDICEIAFRKGLTKCREFNRNGI